MLDVREFGAVLGEFGFREFSGVPCSYLAPLINYAINENRFVMAANEGEAVAIASGISLGRHSVLSDKSGNLRSDFRSFASSKLPQSSLDNPLFSSQSLECQKSGGDSRVVTESSSGKSQAVTESKYTRDSEHGVSETLRGEVFCDDFACFASEDEEATLSGSARSPNEAIKQKRAKDERSVGFGVVLMQNSGLSNALSPLTSLNHTFGIPILGFVSLRGERDERGKNTDEPQHELLGVITDKLLAVCAIEYAFLSADFEKAKAQVAHAREVLDSGKCFFFIVRDKTFAKVPLTRNPLSRHSTFSKEISFCDKSGGESQSGASHELYNKAKSYLDSQHNTESNHIDSEISTPTRLSALAVIQRLATESASVLLATTGKCGRELYELGDRDNQLYMVGSMGCVSSLGLGIALQSEKKVIAIDGDSALLMRLGSLSTNAYYAKVRDRGNFCHILLDNESHDSTGGQFNLSPFVDFGAVARACGYERVCCAGDLSELEGALSAFVECESGGAWFVYLRIAKGSKDPLGRPKITPKEVAARLQTFLN